MAELYGLSLTQHLDNIFNELESLGSIYGYPMKQMYRPGDRDVSVSFHGKRAATPLGPASGPHTQMVQNIVLSFLGGCRIMELKTVQILDELDIPRPCIDARTIGYNVEWSQEMKLGDSYHEYVTAWVVLKILESEETLGYPKGDPFYDMVFDMSVGYDLKGISSEPVTNWIRNIKNAQPYISELLAALPERYERFKSLDIDPVVSNTLTLSTFHGCPRDEIQGIVEYLIGELELDVYVKMNPTQLGYDFVRNTLTHMGYEHIELDRHAFDEDLQFDEGIQMMKRLLDFAKERGRRTGAKFTNTLVVKNKDTFFKDEVMYLSGTPLHVLSMNAMANFRKEMGPEFQTSFSAGVDQQNFVDTVSCNMVPVTVCTDFLHKGGYTRGAKYMATLEKALTQDSCETLSAYIQKRGEADSLNEAGLSFTLKHVPSLADNVKYHHAKNSKMPKKVGTELELFDCLTCNICLPVCPNAANVSLDVAPVDVSYVDLFLKDGSFEGGESLSFKTEKKAQIANLADFCNECANCEVFCPEDGGPQKAKPRFFASEDTYTTFNEHDGFIRIDQGLKGRIDGFEYTLQRHGDNWLFESALAALELDGEGSLMGGTPKPALLEGGRVDLYPFHAMKVLYLGLEDSGDYASSILGVGQV